MRKTIVFTLVFIFSFLIYGSFNVKALNEPIFLDTDNEVIWANGVHDLKVSGPDSDFQTVPVNHGDLSYHEYYSFFDPNKGYFDINKSDDRIKDAYLCFAVSASNALTWWFRENNELIEQYLAENPDISHYDDINHYKVLPTSQYDSNIYKLFVEQYAYRRTGTWPDILIDHFLNGYKPKENGGINDEDWDGDILLENGPARGGGFFFELLGKNKLSDRTLPSYESFSKMVIDSLRNDSLVLMTYDMVAYAHVVTVWGAELNKDGSLHAVYYSDSDDDKIYGLKRVRVINRNGFPYITTEINNKSASLVSAISTISLGRKYFGVHTHNYGEPKWNLNDINNVTATFTCKEDPSHQEVIKASVKEIINDSTCLKSGESYKVASVNFNNKTYESNKFDLKEISKKEHDYSDFVIEIEPTCNNVGKRVKTCKLCNDKIQEIIPKLEHKFNDFIIEKEPTCHEEGIKVKECSICREKVKESIPKLEHNYSDYEVVVKESCISEGLLIRHCLNCEAKENKLVPKLEHISDDIYHFEDNMHYNLCKNLCCTKLNLSHCSGGKATIYDKAICTICNHEYGDVLENNSLVTNPEKIDYKLKSGNDLIYNVNRELNDLIEVKFNGNVLNQDDYILDNKNIIIKNSYLRKLPENNYVMTLQFSDGYIDYNLNISKDNIKSIVIISTISVVSILVVLGTVSIIYIKKKEAKI